MNNEKLQEVLEKHDKWLRNDKGGKRANLSSADLSSANLRFANLSSANLSYADLSTANLSSADLSYANLSSADLRSADLRSADLSYADLRSANLSSADLSYANLSSANLSSADLSSADLSTANLSSANLRFADLSSADLSTAIGVTYAQCSFTSHGECGRQLTGVVINKKALFFCGCFRGTYYDLIEYIKHGDKRLIQTRTIAAEFVAQALRIENQ